MSKMIPRETIDALRHQVNISLDNFGIDCTLHIPTVDSYNTAEKLDVFATPNDYIYTEYSAKVFIHWSPNVWFLKKLGLFVEGQVPILAYLGNKAINQDGDEVDVNVVLRSYIKITPEFIPNNYKGVEEFEVVNIGTSHMHDAAIVRVYALTPRRV